MKFLWRYAGAIATITVLAGCSEKPAPAPEPAPAQVSPSLPVPAPSAPVRDVAADVKRALVEKGIVGVDATANRGQVRIWGTVNTQALRLRAADIARSVEGVTGVDNQLVVVSGS